MGNAKVMNKSLPEEKRSLFSRIPRAFYKLQVGGKRITPSELAIVGKIYTFSGEDKECHLSYKQIEEELNLSSATTASAIEGLRESGLIEATSRDKHGAAYKFVGELKKLAYDVVPLELHTKLFDINGTQRRLKRSEIRVLGSLMTSCENVKKPGYAEESFCSLEKKLGLCRKTVKTAVYALLRAGLIYRAKEDKGVNRHKLSRIHVNRRLYAYKQLVKSKKKASKRLPPDVEAANARADRARHYAILRQQAENRADTYKRKVTKDPEYKEVKLELGKLQIALARASLYNPEHFPVLKMREVELTRRRAAILHRLQVTEQDLMPQYKCSKCNDSGYLHDGRACDCYPRE